MKKVGYLACGVVLGVSITAATPTLAANVKTITAKINSTVNVVINGKKVSLNTQPITYNNLNYLPVGEIGRALGLDVSYDKQSDSIMIGNKASNEISSSSQNTPSTETETSTKKVKLGESVTQDGITTSVDKIEYVTQSENFDGTILDKGFKVFITVTNNSDFPLYPGALYQFSVDDKIQEQVLNSKGALFLLKVEDNKYMGDPITKGETATGFVYYSYGKDVAIKGISYFPNFVGKSQTSYAPFATWTIE